MDARVGVWNPVWYVVGGVALSFLAGGGMWLWGRQAHIEAPPLAALATLQPMLGGHVCKFRRHRACI
jgi:hypothetical protein